MAHSASVRARALALVLEGGLHFRQAAERLAVELGDGAPHARTIARWVDAEIGAGRAVLPPWVYRRRGEAVVEEAMGMLRAGCPVSEVVETMGVSDGSVRRWAHERGVECFASMSFQQAHQYFSAVWADGFPRSRHHAVSDVR